MMEKMILVISFTIRTGEHYITNKVNLVLMLQFVTTTSHTDTLYLQQQFLLHTMKNFTTITRA